MKSNIIPTSSKQSGLRGGRALLVGAGLALLASAVAVRYKTQQAEMKNPPTGRFIDVDGVRLHYVERGHGQPLVLLHGNGSMTRDFELSGIVDLAADDYRVIVFDRPGYGHSERPRSTIWSPQAQAGLLHQALQKLGVERPIIVGHSWGTLVALAMALEFPSAVRSLVLLSGYYYPTARLDVPLLSVPAVPVVGDVLRYTVSPLISRAMWPGILKQLFGPAQMPQHFEEFPVWMVLRPSQLRASAAESAMMIPAANTLSKRYRELKMPVIIRCGEDDRIVDAHEQSGRLHREIPQSDVVLTPGIGHMIHHLVPHQVMEAIDQAAKASQPARVVSEHVHRASTHLN
ncbi:alpha/beta fold hydrolase [Noviherbaspirillum sp.]|uniref:alpha/beta fold hydrolase n=1 Tax=Noviherbaspirillum sp. TaxID=1926288 RepID=UPI002FE3509F